jgi:methionyl aminopeptidase
MAIRIKTKEDLDAIRRAGPVLARILRALADAAKPGVSTEDLDDLAQELMKKEGAEPVLLGYKPGFAPNPFPAAICTSVNDVVQHGIPSSTVILKQGDIINIDATIGYDGMVVDSGITVGVGKIDKKSEELLRVTREALYVGIAQARPGNHIGDIGYAISKFVKPYGFGVVDALCGHGVGYSVHEDPMIPNFGAQGTGDEIQAGMVFAIEPIINIGSKEVDFDDAGDGYTVTTQDGSRSAHFEHTVIVTEDGPEIVTE